MEFSSFSINRTASMSVNCFIKLLLTFRNKAFCPGTVIIELYQTQKLKMEIEIFTLSDFAQDNNSKLTIVGTFDAIHAKQFPVLHPACAISCRLRFGSKETGSHDFKLRLIDAEGKEIIQPIEGNLNIGAPP